MITLYEIADIGWVFKLVFVDRGESWMGCDYYPEGALLPMYGDFAHTVSAKKETYKHSTKQFGASFAIRPTYIITAERANEEFGELTP